MGGGGAQCFTKAISSCIFYIFSRASSQDIKISAAIKIQAAWRGWLVRHEISQQFKIWLAAITIQAAWRGYCVRKWFKATIEKKRNIESIDPALVEKLHKSATMIQVSYNMLLSVVVMMLMMIMMMVVVVVMMMMMMMMVVVVVMMMMMMMMVVVAVAAAAASSTCRCKNRSLSLMSQCMRFPTMWYFDMCRLGRASAASF